MDYDFEWDIRKARTNTEKHRVTFEDAATVFADPHALNAYDPDHSESEDRWITLGTAHSGRLLVVCHTFTERPGGSAAVRIYSARPATSKEAQSYYERA